MGAAAPTFVDTPKGIFTASGVWFRASEAGVRDYAGEVLQHEPLPRLVRHAEVWLRSPETLALWVLPAALWLLPVGWAVLLALALYVGWSILGPSLVNRPMLTAALVLDHVVAQLVYYVVLLSALAIGGQYEALAAGLLGFVLLRWGLLRRLTDRLMKAVWARLYPMPVPDQVLRALIHRAALKYRVTLPEIDAMANDILAIWYRNK